MVLSIYSDPNTGDEHRDTLVLLALVLCGLSMCDPQGTHNVINLMSIGDMQIPGSHTKPSE